jgi:hypothetical protein
MLRSRPAALVALTLLLPAGTLALPAPVAGQLQPTSWTERPDRHLPAGIRGGLLPTPRTLDLQLHLLQRSFQELMVGTEEIPSVFVLQDFDMVHQSRSHLSVAVEAQAGVRNWLAVALRVPFVHNEAEFATSTRAGKVSASGVGDVEGHVMLRVHDGWPVRAHASAGVAFPTGSVTQTGATPDDPGAARVLPYALQPGTGTFALLPAAVLAVENVYGTVGFHGAGRIYVGENSRDWRPGHLLEGSLFMQYRFNDWVSGSARLAVARWNDVSGADPALNPQASPMHWTLAQGGTRVEVPLGMNLRFAEGPLEGHRLGAEVLLPAHQDLNGPQLRSRFGVTAVWGYTFGAARTPQAAPRRPAPAPPPSVPPAPPAPEEERPVSAGSLCLATGENTEIFLTPQGDTLVGPERVSVRDVGRDAAFPGSYAEGRTWYRDDLPVSFEERSYQRSGGEVGLDCRDVVRVGEHEGVPIFAAWGSERPFEVIYLPVRAGIWHAYRTDLARVRG